jgi:superfamily II DNA/RNA helicase
LLVSGLQQRLLSSIEAFARTLRVHRKTMERHWAQAVSEAKPEPVHELQLELLSQGVGSDDDRATLSEGELEAEEDAQVEAASLAGVSVPKTSSERDAIARERDLLDEMTRIAEASRGRPDARIRRLLEWIREHQCPDLPLSGSVADGGAPARWNETRVILFTEYEDTRRHFHQQLSAAIASTDRADRRIAVYNGPTPQAQREEIKRAFNADPARHPVRILIATDAAREGLNLQTHCWNLFHFDVPWNPSRMEQRNGRIDRKLQPRDEVFCHYFVYHQRVEDRILQALVRKTDTIKRELGSLSQVVEGRLATTLSHGIRHRDVARLEQEIAGADLEAERKRAVEEELEATRERQEALKAQIHLLQGRLKSSQEWIALREDHFRAAISCSLELLGAEPLASTPGPQGRKASVPRYTFPPLDQRHGADVTWAETMDALRPPRPRDQKPWEWRSSSPIRPVVFEDTGTMDDDVVHLHLEHRVVQRLLARFRAQGFVHHDLSRACLAQTTDAIPRVILLGRLCLYGPRAARLHEVIVPVAARWTETSQRRQPLTPYKEDEVAEAKALDLLEASLLPSGRPQVNTIVRDKLCKAAAQDVQELLPHLQTRGERIAQAACDALAKRALAEADAMKKILEEQKQRVGETARKYSDDPQLRIQFNAEEERQLQANQRHWEKRLATLDRELAEEPQRIRAVYDVKAQRIEPVGLVYLWPVTG